jgi:hypothetical protein
MEKAVVFKPEDIRDRNETQYGPLQNASGEALLGLRAKKIALCCARQSRHGPLNPAGL